MKKQYLIPAIEVTSAQPMQMLAESLVISNESVDGSEALTKESADWSIWE